MEGNLNKQEIEENFSDLVARIEALGFDGVLYSFIPKPMHISDKIQPVLRFSESYAPFIEHYLKNNYGNQDFVLRMAIEGRSKEIDWWQEIEAGNVSDQERKVTEEARDLFDIQNGVSVPVLHGSFAIAGISLFSRNPDRENFEKIKQDSLSELKEIATDYHERIIKSNSNMRFFIKPMIEGFSDSKKKVLKQLMSGRPMKSIEDDQGITKRYAEKTLIEIRKEFGNISTNGLMYILGMTNMYEVLVETSSS